MDLVAFTLADTSLAVYRSISWQSLGSVSDPVQRVGFSALTWSPTGKHIAGGLSDGMVCVYDSEAPSQNSRLFCHSEDGVTALHWTQVSPSSSDSDSDSDAPSSRLPLVPSLARPPHVVPTLPDLPPVGVPYAYPPLDTPSRLPASTTPSTTSSSSSFSTSQAGAGQDPSTATAATTTTTTTSMTTTTAGSTTSLSLDVLIAGDSSGVVSLHVAACFRLGRLCVDGPVTDLSSSATLSTLAVATPSPPRLVVVDTSALQRDSGQLAELSHHVVGVIESLRHTERAVEIMREQWSGAVTAVAKQLSGLEKLLRYHGRTSSPYEELNALFVSGVSSDALSQFLQTELSDSVILRLSRVVDSACGQLETLAVHHLSRAAEAIVLHVSRLRAAVAWEEEYGGCGWEYGDFDDLIDCAEALCVKTDTVRRCVSEARAQYAAVFKWLRRAVKLDMDDSGAVEAVRLTVEERRRVSDGLSGACDDLFLVRSVSACFRPDGDLPSSTSDPWLRSSFDTLTLAAHVASLTDVWSSVASKPADTLSGTFKPVAAMGLDGHQLLAMHYDRDLEAHLFAFSALDPDGKVHVLRWQSTDEVSGATLTLPDTHTVVASAQFYGHAGTAELGNTPSLALLLASASDEAERLSLELYEYQDWEWTDVELERVGAKAAEPPSVGPVFAATVPPQTEDPAKRRSLPVASSAARDCSLQAVGTRGVACVTVGGRRVLVFDVEDDPEDDE